MDFEFEDVRKIVKGMCWVALWAAGIYSAHKAFGTQGVYAFAALACLLTVTQRSPDA